MHSDVQNLLNAKSNPQGFEEIRDHLHRQMLSAVSHDLKTPLATIIGSLEIYGRMNDRPSKEKCETLITAALGEAYRLDNFITNILDMAKLEGGSVKLRAEPCNPAQLIGDCITRLGPRARNARIMMQPGEAAETVMADPAMLGRAIGLVIDNAIKHSGPEPLITVEYARVKDDFFVAVRDRGPGILPGKEEMIFCKYTRFARNDQQNAGTGLGLAICRQLMRLHGGSVRAENHPDGGALFTLSLPA